MPHKIFRLGLPAAALALTFSACGSKHPAKNDENQAQVQQNKKPETQETPLYTPPTDVTEASLRGAEFTGVEGLDAIRFDYDSASLKEDALATLKKNAQYMKDHKDMQFLVAGFCDERGTIEYNLALGQKRAKQVREYYIRLGVPGAAVATISYGKEQPVCSESTDDCWAQNRRAETRTRARTAANGLPATAQPQ